MLSSKHQRVAATSRKKKLENEAKKDGEEEKVRKKRPPLTPPSSRVTKTQFFSSKTTPQRLSDTKSTASSSKSSDSSTKPKLVKDSPRILQKTTKNERPSVREFIKKVRQENKKMVTTKSEEKVEVNRLENKKKTTTKRAEVFAVKRLEKVGEANKKKTTKREEMVEKVRAESKKKTTKSDELQRPGTATLKNPVILKKHLEEPSSPTTISSKTSTEDLDYEDDFDSYESDFENESSSTSDNLSIKSSDSSATSSSSSPLIDVTTPLEEKRINSADEEKKLDSGTFDLPEIKHKQVLHNIKESTLLDDEGFEDVKSAGDSGCFINFTSAQKKLKQSRIDAKQRKRGEEILSMIKLDSYTFTLFDLAPMSYERYIKLYGQQNCLQASVQTGDDSVDEECQTEEVGKRSKWTQAPTKFSSFNSLEIYKQDYKGVGCDGDEDDTSDLMENKSSILSAAQLLLNLLQENNSHSLKELQNSDLTNFSTGYIECNTQTVPQLKNTFVTCIAYNTRDSSLFLTAHKQRDGRDCRSFLATWYLSNLNQPERVFVSYGEVTCCCFSRGDTKLVCAGSIDGSVSVWNNKQNFMDTRQVPNCISEVGLGHISKIISIQSVSNLNDDETANQLCTLDCDGCLIFWSVHNVSENIILTQNSKIVLKTNNQTANALLINQLDPNHLFVATSAGYVIHTLMSNTKTHPKKFSAPNASEVTCMAACPFSELYFLAGFQNGCVALYSRLTEKPLILMVDKNSEGRVEQIEWSCSRPCVFYVKHKNVVDIWDLMYSDMVPADSVAFKKRLTCIKEMPTKENYRNLKKSCMIVGYGSGELQLHILNKEHGQNSVESYKQDVKKFLNYVNRL